ncbi:SEC14-like protein 1 [Galendromus occidentalis]|uniref:SEC14-like protein 1 n=1 Tax=Galendromus occidentalis TaxID=34638 RepID=A0AAJ7WHM6_9ACAR|nr:SEC14-like protein 1 [Galendromus occidentalis]
MVQEYQGPVRVYKYPFELVMAAYERRFPTCPMIPILLGCDIILEEESPDGAIRKIQRRCRLNIEAPYLLKKIVGVDHMLFIQQNILDRRNKVLKIEAWNESFSGRVSIKEYCTYSVHPDNPNWTSYEQSASLDVKSFYGFEATVEKIAIKQYSADIAKGKEIIEYYIRELKNEGITQVDRWIDPCADGGTGETNSTTNPVEKSNGSAIKESSGGVDTSSSNNKQSQVEKECLSRKKSDDPAIRKHLPLEREHSVLKDIESDPHMKLDSDYIEKCLGHLTPFQESNLVMLKKWMAESHQGKVPSDEMLIRFLKARDFNQEKAREMLCESLVWRKKYAVDKILQNYQIPKIVKEYLPGAWHHSDKDGRPMYVFRLGQIDIKGFIKSIGQEGVMKLVLHICEQGLQLTEEATRRHGRPIRSWTCLLDLEGLNMRHLWRPGIKTLLHIIEVVEANYPETMGRCLVTRAPRVFPILWTLVSTFINENTRAKFIFVGPQGEGISDYIDQKHIPDFLGGQCTVSIAEGGLVPKSFYMTEEEYEREKAEWAGESIFYDSMYHSVSLVKNQVHEVVIEVEDAQSVLCWDFDVIKQDVTFAVFRCPLKSIKPAVIGIPPSGVKSRSASIETEELTSPTGGPQSPLPLLQNLQLEAAVTLLPKDWVAGKDYHVIEQPIKCCDGESVQGSYITSQPGSYVLQWKRAGGSGGDYFDFGSPKSKVMYYCELINSTDYKGSMSSLQSAQSAGTGTDSGVQP